MRHLCLCGIKRKWHHHHDHHHHHHHHHHHDHHHHHQHHHHHHHHGNVCLLTRGLLNYGTDIFKTGIFRKVGYCISRSALMFKKHGYIFFIVAPCILIYVEFTHQQMHFFKHIKIYIKIYVNIAPKCFDLRPSSGSLHWTWLKLYLY